MSAPHGIDFVLDVETGRPRIEAAVGGIENESDCRHKILPDLRQRIERMGFVVKEACRHAGPAAAR